MAVLDLEQRVASAVNVQLETLNGRLEELVERALQDELDRRVAAILETNIEDRSTADEPSTYAEEPASSKACNRCRRTLHSSRFEKGRAVCLDCRRADARRRAEAADPAPFASTGSTATGSPPANPASSSG